MKKTKVVSAVLIASMLAMTANTWAEPVETSEQPLTVVWEDAVLHEEITGNLEVNQEAETWALSYETQYGPDCLQGYYTVEDGVYDSVLTDGGNAGEFAEMAFAGIKPVLDEGITANISFTDEEDADAAVFNVTFIYNIDEYPSETFEIKEGTRLAVCENMGFQNYGRYNKGSWFTEWFADEELTTPYDKNKKADGDVTLYAGWERSFPEVEQMENSPLEGKSIAALGSSVFAAPSGVGEYLAIRFGADLTKEAASGTTLSEVYSNSYVERMKTMDTDKNFDLFLCQLSTNDATQNVPLGEISESTELEDFDTQTVAGALEYIIAYVKENWGCPFILFIGSQYDSEEYGQMVELSKVLSEKWGIGLSNLWDNEEVNGISDELRAEYVAEDGIHPTTEGYQKWWGPYMEAAVIDYLVSLN